MELSTAMKNSALDTVFNNANSGFVRFYNSSNTLIASCAMGSTAFAAASDGSKTANAITKESNTSAGTVSYANVQNSSSTVLATLTVGLAGSGADVILTGLTFASGEELSIASLVVSMP